MASGGKRVGSGRPKGSNIYGESTSPLRVPLSRVEDVKAFLASEANQSIPLFSSSVRAGAPTAADDSIDRYINLNNHLIHNPKSTFLVIASGDSMINAGINHGDMLVVDKSITATSNHIIIASVEGDLTVKRLIVAADGIQLKAENDAYAPILIHQNDQLVILGVVTHVIHQTM
ncbi:MAG: translesion error-prone DNA polymerase V autoproteolytic subunit [bacterium]|nr:translesion error-prone DNA polymerase V autoproteolytic subunit [bacterium]